MKTLMPAIAVLSLAGCQTVSTPLAVEPPRLHVDASLLAPCGEVATVPDRELGPDEAARLWGRDRAGFGDCRRRQGALAQTVRKALQ